MDDRKGSKLPTGLTEQLTGAKPGTESTILAFARSHMANENTHLSHLRMAVSLMSFGITLNRFSIYLVENDKLSSQPRPPVLGDLESVGIGMVALAMILLVWALYRYYRVSREIETMTFRPPYRAMTILTVLITIMGATSTLWMIMQNG